MTTTPSSGRSPAGPWRRDPVVTGAWKDLDRGAIASRYDRLARILPLFDWLFFQPPSFRRKAAQKLQLQPGSRVLEVGCGTGRNLPYLREVVGPAGRVYGVDISPGMLAKAHETCARERWMNIELLEQDALDFAPSEPLDGVMFGLSYNTMPHHLAVLHHVWTLLRPGGSLVIMDAKLPDGAGGRMILPFSLWLMKRTMLGNPLIKPWEDLAQLAGSVEMQQFMFGSWYICRAVKN